MREHPDYKYRPRRKPKMQTVQKKKATDRCDSGKPVPYSVRDLLPQHDLNSGGSAVSNGNGRSNAAAAADNGSMLMAQSGEQHSATAVAAAAAMAKLPSVYFSPYHHYPASSFYQQMFKEISAMGGGGNDAPGKTAHDLAFQAFYGYNPLYYGASTVWPAMIAANVTTAGSSSSGGGPPMACPIDCTECGQNADRPHRPTPPTSNELAITAATTHESLTPSTTPSPLAHLPQPPLSPTAVYKRPAVTMLVKPERVFHDHHYHHHTPPPHHVI